MTSKPIFVSLTIHLCAVGIDVSVDLRPQLFAAAVNNRPRKILGYRTPSEVLTDTALRR